MAPGPLRPARFSVGYRSQTFIDTSRPTAASNGMPSAPTRTLPTMIYYPATTPVGSDPAADAPVATAGRPFPLVVFAHGLDGFPQAYQTLLGAWAAAGYVVAAPTFPLTHFGAPWSALGDYDHQPSDVRFVLTSVLAEAAAPASPFHGAVDASRVAVAGHSLGAITVLGLLNTCCRDARIDAVIVLAGLELRYGTGNQFFVGPALPVLFEHATNDSLVPYGADRQAYAAAPAPKFFVTLPGADHVLPYLASPAKEATAAVVTRTTLDFLDAELGHDPTALDRLRGDAQVPGVARFDAAP